MAGQVLVRRTSNKAHLTSLIEGTDSGILSGIERSTSGAATLWTDNNVTTLTVGGGSANTAITLMGGSGTGTVSIGNASAGALSLLSGSTIGVGSSAAGAVTINSGSTITIGANATAITLGSVGKVTTIAGDLVVDGTTTTVNSETVNISDNHLNLNAGYTTAAGQSGGVVVNYLPTATADTSDTGGFASSSTVNTVGAATFSAGDFVQVSGAANPQNEGIYEVVSHSSNLLTIDTTPTFSFAQSAFTVDTGDTTAVLTKINVSLLQAKASDGAWQVGTGSTVAGLTGTLADLTVGGAVSWATVLATGSSTGANNPSIATGQKLTAQTVLELEAPSGNSIQLQINDAAQWTVAAGSLTTPTNANIGANGGAANPANIFASTSIVAADGGTSEVTLSDGSVAGSGALTVTATGAALGLVATGANPINFTTNGAAQWAINSSGDLVTASDGLNNIGGSSTTLRPANVWASSTVGAALGTDVGVTLSVSGLAGTSAATAATAGQAVTVAAGAGNTSGAGGAMTVTAGAGGASGAGGALSLTSGGATAGASGAVELLSGDSSTSGNTGALTIKSGDATSGDSGNLTIDSGTASGTTGTVTVGGVNASAVNIMTGSNTGTVSIGNASAGAVSVNSSSTMSFGSSSAGAMTINTGSTLSIGTNSSGVTISSASGGINLDSTGASTWAFNGGVTATHDARTAGTNAGWAFSWTAGTGGAATGAGAAGGAGGDITMLAGVGGAGSGSDAPGLGGDVFITGAAGGAGTGTQVGGTGGSVYIAAGAGGGDGGAGAGAAGDVNIGNTNTSVVAIVTTGTGNVDIALGSGTLDLGDGSTGAVTLDSGSTITVGANTTGVSIVGGSATGTVTIGNSAAGAITIDSSAGISVDAAAASNFTVSGATADLTLGARGATITLNQSGSTTLSGFTATSIVGALNELKTGGASAGQVELTYTDSGSGLAAGAAVYISGNGVITAADATADAAAANFVGVTEASISASGTGQVIVDGAPLMDAVDATYTAGQEIFLSTTAGKITNVAPSSSGNVVLSIGFVHTGATISGGGTVKVQMVRGSKLVV